MAGDETQSAGIRAAGHERPGTVGLVTGSSPGGAPAGASRRLVRLLAVTSGVTVANLYYAQPLLHTLARTFGTGQSAAGMVVTATQAGYACGLLFVVPLGDIVDRRRLMTILLGTDAAALAATAAAPGIAVLAILAPLIGLASVVAQLVVPYAATVAGERERAQAIGTVMGGLLIGVLASRAASGLLADVAGWRSVYAAAAALTVLLAVVIARALPAGAVEVTSGYAAQMRAVLRLAASEPVLRWRSAVGAMQFAAFSCFWTTVTFLLSGPPFRYSQAAIGLFALVGAAGASSALAGGRLLDRHRGLRRAATGGGAAVLLGSFAILGAGRSALAWLIIGALLMDAASQAVHITNQAVIYGLVEAARSRITTVYMTTYFLGGALGTVTGTLAFSRHGWPGACFTAAGFALLALLACLASGRHERRPQLAAAEPAS